MPRESHGPNAVQQDTGRPAVILVIVENALANIPVARSNPLIKPLDRCRTSMLAPVSVPPFRLESAVLFQG